MLDLKPSYSPVKTRGESDSVLVALKAGQECHVAGNSPGVSRRSRQGSILPPCLKGKVFCHLVNLALTAFCLILLSGDISENPGPVKDPCGVCSKGCRKNQKAIQCDDCDVWFHAKCTGVNKTEYANLSARSNTNWTCMNCLFPNYDLNNESSEESVRASLTTNSFDVTDLDADSTHLLKGFKIAHLNINRQVNKMDGIRDLLSRYKFDVLAINKTFLSPDINDTEVTIPEYRLARKDRSNSTKSTGGGVIIFIRDNIPFAVRSDLMDDRAEILWVEITRNKCKPLLITSVYRPPDYSQRNFFDSINSSPAKVNGNNYEIAILWDFNLDQIPGKGRPAIRLVNSFSVENDLKQLICPC